MQAPSKIRFNYYDDSFEITSPNEEEEAPDVKRVEQILEERKEQRDYNANRFLSDLHNKKHKVILNKILSSKEGAGILRS